MRGAEPKVEERAEAGRWEGTQVGEIDAAVVVEVGGIETVRRLTYEGSFVRVVEDNR